eukprot:1158154-Pelagomonas_calceolata.AAC.3
MKAYSDAGLTSLKPNKLFKACAWQFVPVCQTVGLCVLDCRASSGLGSPGGEEVVCGGKVWRDAAPQATCRQLEVDGKVRGYHARGCDTGRTPRSWIGSLMHLLLCRSFATVVLRATATVAGGTFQPFK